MTVQAQPQFNDWKWLVTPITNATVLQAVRDILPPIHQPILKLAQPTTTRLKAT